MIVEHKSLESWLEDLADSSKPFAFSRWGDGEWRAVSGLCKNQANCDGHRYFASMGNELRAVLTSRPVYRLGMQPLAAQVFGQYIVGFLKKHNLSDMSWYDGDVFHKGSIAGRMSEILQAMNRRKVLLVGPQHLKNVPFKYWKQVVVPSRDVYLQLSVILERINGFLKGKGEPLLIAISASMPAELMVDVLHKRYGDLHTIVDFGSLWDPLVGVLSRTYMQRLPKS